MFHSSVKWYLMIKRGGGLGGRKYKPISPVLLIQALQELRTVLENRVVITHQLMCDVSKTKRDVYECSYPAWQPYQAVSEYMD